MPERLISSTAEEEANPGVSGEIKMADYSRKRFDRIKKQNPNREGCLLLAADDNASVFWSYNDDAVALSNALHMRYSVSKKGPVITVAFDDLTDRTLEEVNNDDGAFYLLPGEPERKDPADPWEKGNDTLPGSALLRAKVIRNEEIKTLVVVSDPKEQDSPSGVYWEGRTLARKLLTAVHMGTRFFTLKDESYIILRVFLTEDYFETAEKRYYFLDAASEPKTVYISKQLKCGDADNYEPVTALFYCAGSSEPAEMTVYYSPDEDEYYIDISSYELFREKYGLPYVTLKNKTGESFSSYSFLADKSELFMYGYNVKQDGPGTQERQRLIANLIDCGLMSKKKIHDYLSLFILRSESKPSMINAVAKWKEDLVFLDSYHKKDQRAVWVSGFKAKGGGPHAL